VNFEALLLFGSGLNHLSVLSRNHVSCGDLHLVDHYSWIRIVIASHFLSLSTHSLYFCIQLQKFCHHLVSEQGFVWTNLLLSISKLFSFSLLPLQFFSFSCLQKTLKKNG
jgi:hypothetical protein